MKTKTTIIQFLSIVLLSTSMFAQDKTTVRANSSDISDNLDLRAIASIFGDASDLEDFENKINDPEAQISNLDLNNDNYVDYLRVIESVEGNAHLIIIQSVLEKDTYQDVATIEVEKDRNNNVQVQVVGNVYMYGENYIYEPVYLHTPVIYTSFWAHNYRPYYSNWHWNYYPNYYYAWNPFPIFRYRNHIGIHINFGHSYHYVSNRSCHTAYGMYHGRRSYAYETRHPNRSFSHRNHGYSNRHEMNNDRPVRNNVRPRSEIASNNPRNSANPRTSSTRDNASPRNSSPRTNSTPRGNNTREATSPRNTSFEPRSNGPRGNSPRTTSSPRSSNSNGIASPRGQSQPKASSTRTRNTGNSSTRSSSPRSSSNSRNSSNARNSG
jgi:hypothetical protein